MHRIRILTFFLLLASPFVAPAEEWRQAAEHDLLLTNYDIAPEILRLKAGEPVRLHFINNSDKVHDFSAASFFGAARLRKHDAQTVASGGLKLGPGQTLTVALVPKAGRYRMKSGNFLRRLLGMSGTIIVE